MAICCGFTSTVQRPAVICIRSHCETSPGKHTKACAHWYLRVRLLNSASDIFPSNCCRGNTAGCERSNTHSFNFNVILATSIQYHACCSLLINEHRQTPISLCCQHWCCHGNCDCDPDACFFSVQLCAREICTAFTLNAKAIKQTPIGNVSSTVWPGIWSLTAMTSNIFHFYFHVKWNPAVVEHLFHLRRKRQ